MSKPMLWAAGAFLLMGIGTAGVVYAVSSGPDEAVHQVATTTPGNSTSPSPTTSSSATPIATRVPTATPPVPEDWGVYSVPEAGLTLRYPSAWYSLRDGGIYSWDPDTWDKPWWPPEAVKVDVIYGPTEFAEPRPAEAVDFSIAAGLGWEITYPKDPAKDDGLTRVHEIAIGRAEFQLFIIAYFSQVNPDEETFSQIVNSLHFAG